MGPGCQLGIKLSEKRQVTEFYHAQPTKNYLDAIFRPWSNNLNKAVQFESPNSAYAEKRRKPNTQKRDELHDQGNCQVLSSDTLQC